MKARAVQNNPRYNLAQEFLDLQGLSDAKRVMIAGDASFRKYERILSENKSFILMDAPPEKEDVKPFIQIAEYLYSSGFSAPQVIAKDNTNGFLLLEDLGNDLYSAYLRQQALNKNFAELEKRLYLSAIDVLLELAYKPLPENTPLYDLELYLREALLFADWYLPALLGHQKAQNLKPEFADIMKNLLSNHNLSQEILVLRDYHADNLLWLPDREFHKKVGLLDFQDGALGAPEYDIVSLLEDARRDVLPQTVEECISHYLAKTEKSAESFKKNYHLLGAQRNLKIIGIFHRLNKRDGKPGYLSFLPRVWVHLEKDLEHPYLAPLKDWMNKNIPKDIRK